MMTLSDKKFTKQVWLDKVNANVNSIKYNKGTIKGMVNEVISVLQRVILEGDMLYMKGAGRFVVVLKEARFGVRNVHDLSKPAFSLPKRFSLCFYSMKNMNALDGTVLMNPEFKKVKFSNALELIDKITSDRDLSLLILSTLTDAVSNLLVLGSEYGKVEIRGLICLSQSISKERIGRNPKTGEILIIDEKLKISFSLPNYFKNELKKLQMKV